MAVGVAGNARVGVLVIGMVGDMGGSAVCPTEVVEGLNVCSVWACVCSMPVKENLRMDRQPLSNSGSTKSHTMMLASRREEV